MALRVLSIDWDYFVEMSALLDWQHIETGFHLTTLWDLRRIKMSQSGDAPQYVSIETMAPFRGDEAFLIALAARWPTCEIGIAESHAAILHMLGDYEQLDIINIDAHHDIFYNKKPRAREDVDCGNWGGYLMLQDRVRTWRQCYPAWRQKRPNYREHFPMKFARQHCRVSVEYGEPKINWRKADVIFVCRSGCWTPPEYDKRFNMFVKLLGAPGNGIAERAISSVRFTTPLQVTLGSGQPEDQACLAQAT